MNKSVYLNVEYPLLAAAIREIVEENPSLASEPFRLPDLRDEFITGQPLNKPILNEENE